MPELTPEQEAWLRKRTPREEAWLRDLVVRTADNKGLPNPLLFPIEKATRRPVGKRTVPIENPMRDRLLEDDGESASETSEDENPQALEHAAIH